MWKRSGNNKEAIINKDGAQYMMLKNLNPFSLDELGIDGVAYKKEEALLIVQHFLEEVIPILGGDVYYLIEGKPCYTTYAGWSCDMVAGETFSDYVKRSCEEAKKYIESFPAEGKSIPLFNIVEMAVGKI